MKKKSILVLFLCCISATALNAQQLGNGVEQYVTGFNGPIPSGMYQQYGQFLGRVPDNTHDWCHLLVLRHSNEFNNHQLQVASSYSENDRLFFRKIATGNLDASYGSQWYELATRGANRFTGNIGIGPADPRVPLHVSDSKLLDDGSKASAILGNAYNEWVYIGGQQSGRLRGGPGEGYLCVDSYPIGTNNTLYLNQETSGDIRIGLGGGRTFIGISTSTSVTDKTHKLFVNGGIRTDKVTVDNVTSWPDYVFQPAYKLKPLSEVETFINDNSHLPDMPSEQEVKDKGLDVADMNAKLLQKVEELTLYLIDQNKKIDQLSKENRALKRKVDQAISSRIKR